MLTRGDVLSELQGCLRWLAAGVGTAVIGMAVYRLQNRRGLRFSMRAKIEPPNVSPRPQLTFRFLNTGKTAIHIERIEGDNGFSFGDFIDPFTVPADPEPYEDDVPAPYVGFLTKRPTRIYAIDSTGKRWRLPPRDVKRIYQVLEAHERETQGMPGALAER